MRYDDFETSIKIVVVGNGIVGKSSMIQRYCCGFFSSEYKKTIGVDFLERIIRVDTTEIRLMLWDTAGQEEFDALTKVYYRGAQGCLIVFSTTDRKSFDAVEKWKKKVEYECGYIPMVLVQNKIDLSYISMVSRESVQQLSKRLDLPLFVTSAKKNINIDEVFYFLAKSYLRSLEGSFDDLDSFVRIEKPISLVRTNSLCKLKHNEPASPVNNFLRKSKPSLKQRFTNGSSNVIQSLGPIEASKKSYDLLFGSIRIKSKPIRTNKSNIIPNVVSPYKRRFHWVPTPIRQAQPSSSPTIVLHRTPHPLRSDAVTNQQFHHHPFTHLHHSQVVNSHHPQQFHRQMLHPPHPNPYFNYIHHRKEDYFTKRPPAHSSPGCWIL